MGRTCTLLLLILPLFSQLQNFCSVTDQSRLTLLASFFFFSFGLFVLVCMGKETNCTILKPKWIITLWWISGDRCEVCIVVIKITIFCVETVHSLGGSYQHFKGIHWHHLQCWRVTLPWIKMHQFPSKCWYPVTKWQGVLLDKISDMNIGHISKLSSSDIENLSVSTWPVFIA